MLRATVEGRKLFVIKSLFHSKNERGERFKEHFGNSETWRSKLLVKAAKLGPQQIRDSDFLKNLETRAKLRGIRDVQYCGDYVSGASGTVTLGLMVRYQLPSVFLDFILVNLLKAIFKLHCYEDNDRTHITLDIPSRLGDNVALALSFCTCVIPGLVYLPFWKWTRRIERHLAADLLMEITERMRESHALPTT